MTHLSLPRAVSASAWPPAGDLLGTLPLARLHCTVRAEDPLQLPLYAGSMLRGALGHALQRRAPLPHDTGQPCALRDRCIYCQVFATPPLPDHPLQAFSRMPPAYVMEPPEGGRRLQPGQHWTFSLVLIGRGLDHAGEVVQALAHALQRGLGPRHSVGRLLAVQDEAGQRLWEAGATGFRLAVAPEQPAPVRVSSDSLTLDFTTPLRLQLQGRPASRERLTARALLIALARRWQLLADTHLGRSAPQLDFTALSTAAEAVEVSARCMNWQDWSRYSSRQRQRMTLGGLMGPLNLRGPLEPFQELLHLGQWLHVGKETAFGLGRYQLFTTSSSSPPSS